MSDNPQLDAYVQQMPAIYKDVLESYPRVDPTRKQGYGLAVPTIHANLENFNKHYSLGEIWDACRNLAGSGIVEMKQNLFASPTPSGEMLIEKLTNVKARSDELPPISPPPFPSSAGM